MIMPRRLTARHFQKNSSFHIDIAILNRKQGYIYHLSQRLVSMVCAENFFESHHSLPNVSLTRSEMHPARGSAKPSNLPNVWTPCHLTTFSSRIDNTHFLSYECKIGHSVFCAMLLNRLASIAKSAHLRCNIICHATLVTFTRSTCCLKQSQD